MDFGNILKESWKEYRDNFSSIFKLMFIFFAIPLIIIFILSIIWLFSSGVGGDIQNVFSSLSLNNMNNTLIDEQLGGKILGKSIGFLVLQIIFLIIAVLISYFAFIGITSVSLKKKKFSFREVVKEGKIWYWSFIGFGIVYLIFLLGLFLLLVIPGLIFLVYWLFAPYIFINEKKGIIGSLKESFRLVKHRWWITFGYLLLFGLILIGISLVFAIPSFITSLGLLVMVIRGEISIPYLVFNQTIKFIFNTAANFIIIPLSILFFKNFYFASMKEKK